MCISCGEKLNGVSYVLGVEAGGVVGQSFKKNTLELLPHPWILKFGPCQKGVVSMLLRFWRVPLKSTRCYSLAAVDLCSALLHTGTEHTGTGRGMAHRGRAGCPWKVL